MHICISYFKSLTFSFSVLEEELILFTVSCRLYVLLLTPCNVDLSVPNWVSKLLEDFMMLSIKPPTPFSLSLYNVIVAILFLTNVHYLNHFTNYKLIFYLPNIFFIQIILYTYILVRHFHCQNIYLWSYILSQNNIHSTFLHLSPNRTFHHHALCPLYYIMQ